MLDSPFGDEGSAVLSARLAFLRRRDPDGGMDDDGAAVHGDEERARERAGGGVVALCCYCECSLPVLAGLHVGTLLLPPFLGAHTASCIRVMNSDRTENVRIQSDPTIQGVCGGCGEGKQLTIISSRNAGRQDKLYNSGQREICAGTVCVRSQPETTVKRENEATTSGLWYGDVQETTRKERKERNSRAEERRICSRAVK